VQRGKPVEAGSNAVRQILNEDPTVRAMARGRFVQI
jgi:hypothetical protein